MRRVRIGFLLPHYSQKSRSFMPDVVRILAESGAVVDVIHPPDGMLEVSRVRVKHDLYVLRHTSGLSLSLAGVLDDLVAQRGRPGIGIYDDGPPLIEHARQREGEPPRMAQY